MAIVRSTGLANVDQERMEKRKQFRRRWKRACLGYGALLLVPCAAWAWPVLKAELGEYTLQEMAVRLLPFAMVPLLAWLMNATATAVADWRERRDVRHLQTLRKKQAAMISELKDRTAYEKTQQLLLRYDPETRKAYAQAQVQRGQLRTSTSTPGPRPGPSSQVHPSRMLSPTGAALMEKLTSALVGDSKAPALEAQNAMLLARVEAMEGYIKSRTGPNESLPPWLDARHVEESPEGIQEAQARSAVHSADVASSVSSEPTPEPLPPTSPEAKKER